LAEDRDTARTAAQLVDVTYEDLEAVFTIEASYKKNDVPGTKDILCLRSKCIKNYKFLSTLLNKMM